MSRRNDLVVLRPEGLYCPAGDFHIDPWRPVPRAVITHGHGDHARGGMQVYHCTRASEAILRWRLGDVRIHTHDWGESFRLGGVEVSLHSAGHVLGSAQVRIDDGEQVWVASGDYKRQPDPTCDPFEVVPCDTFITEATFASPIYRWPDTREVAADIVAWRRECAERGEAAILLCYSLGKAQRVLGELLLLDDQPAWVHGAIDNGVQVYRQAGIPMLATEAVAEQGRQPDSAGRLVIAPPSAAGTPWVRRFGRHQLAFASGWMHLRGNRRRRNVDRGFVVSDHADWPALLQTIEETGARRIIATHGNTDALIRYLRERDTAAEAFRTDYGSEE